ncbi:hypothetical protein IJJ46_01175 [Candidatus Saccharibacteria bacterium]|nr:hypothetical protein [Candidatus Saccharibacteria bacterium]
MATKQSKSTKNKNDKKFGISLTILGFIVVILVSLCFGLLKHVTTYESRQKILAFEGLASAYIDKMFDIEGEQGASITGSGVTKDKDYYVDFVITKFENHIPIQERAGRLHFQCHNADGSEKDHGCNHAFWYGDWKDTSEETREAYRKLLDNLS